MKIGPFAFNLREFSGSLGDFGTLLPLAVGYIVACGLNPAGFLVMMGLANIVTGIAYRLPMPIEPMKVLAIVAIAQHWSPSLIHASAFAMGLVWIGFAATNAIGWIERWTPDAVVRGIQATLGILLAVEAVKMMSGEWLLGLLSVAIVLFFRNSRYAPAAVVLLALGLALVAVRGQGPRIGGLALSLPVLTLFPSREVWDALVLAGFAQIPLTVTNATIATAALIRSYWPERNVTVQHLSWSQGVMNLLAPLFGGMPMCHGAGGLAGQYYFGARTGGANIIEGAIEIGLGLFLASSIAGLFTVFPRAIVGAMMLLVGVELTKSVRKMRWGWGLLPFGATVVASLLANMAVGFLAGIAAHHILRISRRKDDAPPCRRPMPGGP